MNRAHFDAFRDLLLADPVLAPLGHDTVRVDEGGVPMRATYWVLFGNDPDRLGDDRLTKPQDLESTAEYVYTLRAVSTTPDGVRSLSDKSRAALIGKRPVLAGRRFDPIRLTHTGPIKADTEIPEPLYYSDVEYTLVSRRG